MSARWLVLGPLLAVALAGCTTNDVRNIYVTTPEASAGSAGAIGTVRDSGAVDATHDAASEANSPKDAAPDAPASDASADAAEDATREASTPEDAAPEAAPPDAGSPDAGWTPPDGGTSNVPWGFLCNGPDPADCLDSWAQVGPRYYELSCHYGSIKPTVAICTWSCMVGDTSVIDDAKVNDCQALGGKCIVEGEPPGWHYWCAPL